MLMNSAPQHRALEMLQKDVNRRWLGGEVRRRQTPHAFSCPRLSHSNREAVLWTRAVRSLLLAIHTVHLIGTDTFNMSHFCFLVVSCSCPPSVGLPQAPPSVSRSHSGLSPSAKEFYIWYKAPSQSPLNTELLYVFLNDYAASPSFHAVYLRARLFKKTSKTYFNFL